MYRLGTTSYILPDDLAPNARFLSGLVQDIELILFEEENGPGNLPGADTLDEMCRIAEQSGISYTVHLPLDLRLADDDGDEHVSMIQARRVIECTKPLDPLAYVVHLDRRTIQIQAGSAGQRQWENQAARALEQAAGWVGDPAKLAVENLEGFPPEINMEVLEKVPVRLCIDVGHLWLDDHDALRYLETYLERASVIHLHGVRERDHQSLALVRPEKLRQVMDCLKSGQFDGVVTLEIFNEYDLRSSLEALQAVEEMP